MRVLEEVHGLLDRRIGELDGGGGQLTIVE
jgi:hypothetical protein